MTIDFQWLYGLAVGLIIADDYEKEALGIEWGFCLMLGPVALFFEKEIEE